MNISVCIATYRRPDRLAKLLADLINQRQLPQEVVVVDNDYLGSAGIVMRQVRAAGIPFLLSYTVQPLKNIAMTRNQTVALAHGDWLAFIDDDERAPRLWLEQMADAVIRYDADGMLGPVVPVLPAFTPGWLRHGHFYDWPRMRSGTTVPPNRLRFGNVLLRSRLLKEQQPVFDPAYGLTGGEDGDLLTRLVQAGAQLMWCDEAKVEEPVELSRLNLRWLLLRGMRGGQDFARHTLAGRYGPVTVMDRIKLLMRSLAQMILGGLLALICLPVGRQQAAQWLIKASANLGKTSALLGYHYREYA